MRRMSPCDEYETQPPCDADRNCYWNTDSKMCDDMPSIEPTYYPVDQFEQLPKTMKDYTMDYLSPISLYPMFIPQLIDTLPTLSETEYIQLLSELPDNLDPRFITALVRNVSLPVDRVGYSIGFSGNYGMIMYTLLNDFIDPNTVVIGLMENQDYSLLHEYAMNTGNRDILFYVTVHLARQNYPNIIDLVRELLNLNLPDEFIARLFMETYSLIPLHKLILFSPYVSNNTLRLIMVAMGMDRLDTSTNRQVLVHKYTDILDVLINAFGSGRVSAMIRNNPGFLNVYMRLSKMSRFINYTLSLDE